MSLIVFSHGNSFPASTYRVMLDSLRARERVPGRLKRFQTALALCNDGLYIDLNRYHPKMRRARLFVSPSAQIARKIRPP